MLNRIIGKDVPGRRVASDKGHLAVAINRLGYEGFPQSQRQAAEASGRQGYCGPEKACYQK